EDRLLAAAGPVLGQLRDQTGESAQLFRRQGELRLCVAAAERPVGLRDSAPIGATLSMRAGSAAQVLLACEEPDRLHTGLRGARRRAWALSTVERERGRASVWAGVPRPGVCVVAPVSACGPVARLTRQPGRLHAMSVSDAVRTLADALVRG